MSELQASDFVASWSFRRLVLVVSYEDPTLVHVCESSELPSVTDFWPGCVVPLMSDVCHMPTIRARTEQVRQQLWRDWSTNRGDVRGLRKLIEALGFDLSLDVVVGSAERWVPANSSRIATTSTVEDVIDMALNGDCELLHAGDVADALDRLRNP